MIKHIEIQINTLRKFPPILPSPEIVPISGIEFEDEVEEEK